MTAADVTHDRHDMPTDVCPEATCHGVLMLVTAADVTDEHIEWVTDLVDSNYGNSPIDWQAVFDDRLDGTRFTDNRVVNLGPDYDTPAMRKIQRQVRKARSAG